MTVVHRSAIVPLPASALYALVNNVRDYPRWFNWCEGSEVLAEDEHSMHARLDLKVGPMQTAFSTHNRLWPDQRIELSLTDGPLESLSGAWTFKALGEQGCRVGLDLRFEFGGRLLGEAFRRGFEHLANRMVDDFVRVARAQAAEKKHD
ncbi:MAG: type II toxin-antitoxin system RatA family toxin [Xanthomonadales bacterium]|nr:type II toxin-antitoxin system RatA family toxin [Xanthomonadales bacterium]